MFQTSYTYSEELVPHTRKTSRVDVKRFDFSMDNKGHLSVNVADVDPCSDECISHFCKSASERREHMARNKECLSKGQPFQEYVRLMPVTFDGCSTGDVGVLLCDILYLMLQSMNNITHIRKTFNQEECAKRWVRDGSLNNHCLILSLREAYRYVAKCDTRIGASRLVQNCLLTKMIDCMLQKR